MEETCLYDDRNQLSERKTIDNAGKGWTFPWAGGRGQGSMLKGRKPF